MPASRRSHASAAQACNRARMPGMTLIELLVVVALVAILTFAAVPSYRAYAVRAHRVEATTALLALSAAQEKFYLQNNTYTAELADAPPDGPGDAGGHGERLLRHRDRFRGRRGFYGNRDRPRGARRTTRIARRSRSTTQGPGRPPARTAGRVKGRLQGRWRERATARGGSGLNVARSPASRSATPAAAQTPRAPRGPRFRPRLVRPTP